MIIFENNLMDLMTSYFGVLLRYHKSLSDCALAFENNYIYFLLIIKINKKINVKLYSKL